MCQRAQDNLLNVLSQGKWQGWHDHIYVMKIFMLWLAVMWGTNQKENRILKSRQESFKAAPVRHNVSLEKGVFNNKDSGGYMDLKV